MWPIPAKSRELVLFGRSPFVDTVLYDALRPDLKTVGFNHFGRHHEVDYLFFFDSFCGGWLGSPQVFVPYYFRQQGSEACTRYVPKPHPRPIVPRKEQNGLVVLGQKYFTPAMAINWGILSGFKTFYLVGIDHREGDTRFVHHDGQVAQTVIRPEAHARFKEYVYAATEHARIYQTNPEVAADWRLPYKDIGELYA